MMGTHSGPPQQLLVTHTKPGGQPPAGQGMNVQKKSWMQIPGPAALLSTSKQKQLNGVPTPHCVAGGPLQLKGGWQALGLQPHCGKVAASLAQMLSHATSQQN